jgi:hypothetical protein
LGAILTTIVTFVAMLIVYHARATSYNNYVLLASAILHGHVWVASPGAWIDALTYQGRQYIIEGPFPAILLVPAVAIWGLNTNQALLSYILTSLATGAAWGLAARLGVPWRSRLLLVLFLLLGTDLFFCGIFGDVWYLAHVSAVCFTLFALLELTGKKRAWIVLLFAVCAAFSRFSLVLAIPVYIFVLMYDGTPEQRRARATSIFSIGVIAAGLWLRYNRLRWGLWYDIGYTAWFHQDTAGQPVGSPFSLAYLPMQLYAFFLYPPVMYRGFPYLGVTQWATGLPFTSPALFLAFLARRPGVLVLALWAAAVLVAIPNFLYYVVGFTQFGMRHALDFEPFLFALMCLGSRKGVRWWGALLCLYSVLAGSWGFWFWTTFVRRA